MNVGFTPDGWNDYLYWKDNDPAMFERVNELIKVIVREPFTGIGKPEPLKGNLAGYWSRRIDPEHRLIYRVQGAKHEQQVIIIKARFHY